MILCRTSLTHYTPNTGTSALRKAIVAKLAAENGINYDPSEIVISNGAKQSIWQAVLATVSPGEEVRHFCISVRDFDSCACSKVIRFSVQ